MFLLWYFYGTGDAKIIDRIFNFVDENWEELISINPVDTNKLMLINGARWSLIIVASQQDLVRRVIEQKQSSAAQDILKNLR
ncbi:MAG: hypothetical protein GY744_07850 [Gammaproteobacteria bacterium]|nr:hypothetical protein [Gammaproteobacteria bacterium]